MNYRKARTKEEGDFISCPMRVIFILLHWGKAGQEQIPVQILLNVNRFLLARRGDAFPTSTETLLSLRKHKYNVKTDHRFRHDFGSSSWLLQIWEKDKEFKQGIMKCVCVCVWRSVSVSNSGGEPVHQVPCWTAGFECPGARILYQGQYWPWVYIKSRLRFQPAGRGLFWERGVLSSLK